MCSMVDCHLETPRCCPAEWELPKALHVPCLGPPCRARDPMVMTTGNHAQTPAPSKVLLSSRAVTSHLSRRCLPPSPVHLSLTATHGGSARRPQGTWGCPGPSQGQGGQPPPVSPGMPGSSRPPHAASCKRPHHPAAWHRAVPALSPHLSLGWHSCPFLLSPRCPCLGVHEADSGGLGF